jgi:ATP-binding cassette, subfamily B, bacterial PglK
MFKIYKIFTKKHKILLLIALCLLLLLTFFEILIFSSLQEILNYLNETDGNNTISNLLSFIGNINFKTLLVIFFIVYILRSLLFVALSFIRNKLVKKINDDIANKVFTNYLKKDFSFFIKTSSSKLISNIIIEVERFAYRTVDPLIYFIAEFFIIIAVFIYLSFSYFQGTMLMTLIIFSFYLTFYKFYKNIFVNIGKVKSDADAKKIEDLQKSFYIINEIKIGKLEEFFKKKFSFNTQNSSRSSFILNFYTDVPKALIELVSLIFIFSLLYYSYFFLNFDKKDIISMSGIFVIALFRLLPSANRMYHSYNAIKYNYSSIDIIYSELRKKNISQNNNRKKIDYRNGGIDIKNLSYFYESKENKILDDISLNIPEGKLVGIYGESGSGKSTFLNLICGLLDPCEGSITYNNKNILDDKESYFDLIGYVSQNIFLIDDTLKNNIVLGDQEFNLDNFNNSIKLANLTETLDLMSEKENTTLGERGSQISGGQKQRVGIARALYKNSKILVLDEPTSALDDHSEKEILKSINQLKGKVTILIVSHNRGIIDQCDEIYEIKNKKITKKI